MSRCWGGQQCSGPEVKRAIAQFGPRNDDQAETVTDSAVTIFDS